MKLLGIIFIACATSLSYGAVVSVGLLNETKTQEEDDVKLISIPSQVQEVNFSLPALKFNETREADTTTPSSDAELITSILLEPSTDDNDTSASFDNMTYFHTDFKNETRCPPLSLSCNDGTCVPFSFFCDHKPDCLDGSDEDPAFCRKGSPVIICADGQQMLKGHDMRCDGSEDCDDGSDERDCLNSTVDNQKTLLKPCPWEYQFQCSEGTCIDKSQVCDGEFDCPLGVDESLAQCTLKDIFDSRKTDQYKFNRGDSLINHQAHRCENGDILIGKDDITCNGIKDCVDASDERNCKGEYMCRNGAIVMSSSDIRCDGYSDCSDDSDETSCDYNEDGIIQVTNQSNERKLRTYVVIIITLAVCALFFLVIIFAQMRLIRSLRKIVLKLQSKRPIVLTHTTPPPSYAEVTAANPCTR